MKNNLRFEKLLSLNIGRLILTVLVLLRLPPLLVPFFPNIFTSHSVASILAIFNFLYLVFYKKRFFQEIIKRNKTILGLMLFNIFIFSLSILHAQNVFNYLMIIKNHLLSLMIFFTFLNYSLFDKGNFLIKISKVLLFATVLNLILQVSIYFKPEIFYSYLQYVFHPKISNFFSYQFSRSRFFGSTFDEVLTPIIIVLMLQSRRTKDTLFYLLLLSGIVFITVVSNWRTKQLMLFFALFSTFLYLIIIKVKVKWSKIGVLLVGIIMIFFFAYNLSLRLVGQNSILRLIEPNNIDKAYIQSRFEMWQEALEIGKSHPLIGVGLGNYYDYYSTFSKIRTNFSLSVLGKPYIIENPHNIFASLFAETGLFGLLSYLFLLTYFFIIDLKLLFKKKVLQTGFIFAFWSLMLFSLFNPANVLGYLGLFWVLRVR